MIFCLPFFCKNTIICHEMLLFSACLFIFAPKKGNKPFTPYKVKQTKRR